MVLALYGLLACGRCLRHGKRAYRAMSTVASNRRPIGSNHYDLLEVQQDATAEEIKRAFFSQCKKLHPDSDPANPHLHTRFVKLNEAYSVLSRDNSRREYDLSLRLQREAFPGAGRTQPFSYGSPASNPSASSPPTDDERYWQQFYHGPHTSKKSSPEGAARRHRRNLWLVGYCVLIMLGSVSVHYVGFRTIKEVNHNVVEEQNRIFSKIYNESKERARANGVKKQQEILTQKHAQFAGKYRMKAASEGTEK